MRAIIPCAGYGTRVGMSPEQSKELLKDPVNGAPLIEYSLEICKNLGLDPLIVTRKEKIQFNLYCLSKNVDLLIIEPEGEWTKTVLKSFEHWDHENILILPDTRFPKADSIIGNMKKDLKNGSLVSVALHKVKDPTKWCIVEDYNLIEKPHIGDVIQSMDYYAFGLIAFRKYAGYQLFQDLDKYKRYTLMKASFQYLDSFKDITRAGQVEEW